MTPKEAKAWVVAMTAGLHELCGIRAAGVEATTKYEGWSLNEMLAEHTRLQKHIQDSLNKVMLPPGVYNEIYVYPESKRKKKK